MKLRTKICGAAAAVVLISFFSLVGVRSSQFKNETSAQPLSIEQESYLNSILRSEYSQRYQPIQNLPYATAPKSLPIGAESAILLDASTGCIIYEKNADEVIPPASMTKLFAMYVVDEEVSAGRLSYDQIIPLPPECWACNMPPHSSLMFLGEGQIVTLDELLLGLSICSGNDAAYALAYTICGNMEDFVERMNAVAAENGLTHTHFVESSGYSEENTTTAREMATFAKIYLQKHPQSLQKYHSVPSFTYPKQKNLAPGDKLEAQDFSSGYPRHITMGITQQNTNPLLGRLEGCDGLKTGYIDESGYNLALTAIRGNTRFISVTMRGQGANSREGQAGRVQDGTTLMEWAFASFADFVEMADVKPYFAKVYGSRECKSVELVPAFPVSAVTVPFVTGQTLAENVSEVQVSVEKEDVLAGELKAGQVAGHIRVTLAGYLLDEIPLVVDRDVKKGGFIVNLADKFLY